jgi:hypothetical protein
LSPDKENISIEKIDNPDQPKEIIVTDIKNLTNS